MKSTNGGLVDFGQSRTSGGTQYVANGMETKCFAVMKAVSGWIGYVQF